MFVGFRFVRLQRNARFAGRNCCVGRSGERAAHQSGDRCAGNYCFLRHVTFLFLVFARFRGGGIPPGVDQIVGY